jgi:N-acetylglucosamine repressor
MIDIHRYSGDTTLQKKALQTIFLKRQVSRGELTEILRLSLTSVTKFVTALLSDGVVIESGSKDSAIGRKSSLLSINPEYAYIIGVDIGGFAAKLAVVRLDGSIVDEWFIRPEDHDKVPVTNLDPKGLSERIGQIISQYGQDRFMAICVGISGMVDHSRGKVIFCPNLAGWNDVPLASILGDAHGLPVFIDTSARCMALAEQQYGSGIGFTDQIMVSLGNFDIAAALIVDSRLYRGNGGFAGEIGHVMSSGQGDRCTCGNFDCLELSATLKMITARIREKALTMLGYSPLLQFLPEDWRSRPDALSPQIIQKAIEAGDKICYNEVMSAGKSTGIALANLLNILNPGLVILGGSVIEFFPGILDTIRSTIRERVLIPVQKNLEIRPARMDWHGAVAGSAVLAMMDFFSLPGA